MADNTIDSLVLEISSNSKGAEKALDKLVGSLQKLSSSLGGISSFSSAIQNIDASGLFGASSAIKELGEGLKSLSSLKEVGNTLQKVTSSMQRISTIKIENLENKIEPLILNIGKLISEINGLEKVSFDFSQIRSIIQSMSSLGRMDISEFPKKIKGIVRGIKSLQKGISKVDFSKLNATELSTFFRAIANLGGKSALKAAETNIVALGKALLKMMAVLSKAPTVSQNVIQMTQSLAQLAAAGGRAGTASRSLVGSFNSLPASTGKAKKGFSGLAGAIGKFYATYWIFLRAMGGFKKAIDISSDLTEVQNVVDVTFGEMADTMNDFADSALKNYGMSELMAKQIASRFQAMGVSMGFAQGKMSEMSIELTKLTGDMASFYNESQESVAKALQSIFTGETEPLMLAA